MMAENLDDAARRRGPDAMTEASSTIRAAARVGAPPPTAAGPPVLVARSRPGYLGTFSLARLLLVELLVMLPIATVRSPLWTLVVVSAGCLLVAVIALGRTGGRWWTERVALSWSYRHRHGLVPDRLPDPRLRALRTLAADLQVANVSAADGAPVGIGSDSAGWFAIAALVPHPGLRGDIVADVPLGRLARLISDSEQPGAVVQVVLHTTPAPTTALDPEQWCAASYHELLSRYGAVPANQTAWIAVRLDSRALARASVGGPDESRQAPAVVAGLIRRASRAMDRAGVATQVLDADGMLDALAHSCDLTPTAERSRTEPAREEWSTWHSTRLVHTCFWVRQWPAPPASGALVRALATSPQATFTSVAVILEPTEEGVELHCLTRVAAPADQLAAGCRTLTEAARQVGAEVLPLDGEQAPAVYASAPTGGGAR
jgi:type VII secretion protein EccE